MSIRLFCINAVFNDCIYTVLILNNFLNYNPVFYKQLCILVVKAIINIAVLKVHKLRPEHSTGVQSLALHMVP